MSKLITPEQTLLAQRTWLWSQLEILNDPRTIVDPLDNVILDTDSYKLVHASMYDRLSVTKSFSYIEPRIENTKMLFVGLQIWLKRFKPITHPMVNEAKAFFSQHIVGGAEMFPESDWRRVVDEFNGYPPLRIRALDEGTIIDSRNALVTIECNEPGLAWLAAYFETSILRAVWYPTTVATKSWTIRQLLRSYIQSTSDVDVNEATAFIYHDFGARGVSSQESAAIGGAAHILAGSMGTDTISGAMFVNKYYSSDMSAYSVFATEHSIMTMRGKEGEVETVRDIIAEFGRGPGSIVSIVSDGYDIFNLATLYCTELKDEIIASGIRLVVRPDSGDPVTIVVQLLNLFDQYYGSVVNSKGFKVLNVIRILQGDGLSTIDDFKVICDGVIAAGFSLENVVFGQGGGLLQMVNRDTYKFAMKTCAAEVNGKWIKVFKDPVTDSGKRSKSGKLTVIKNTLTHEITTVEYTGDSWTIVDGYTEMMHDVWINGALKVDHTLADVRSRSV